MHKLVWSVVAGLVRGIVGMLLVSSYTYSEGHRAGLLVKFSKKGYVFKTYEGELNLGGINTDKQQMMVNNIWTFSVNDPAAADSLMKCEGRYVRLHYRERLKSFFWQGETNYFVDDVSVIR